MKLKILAVDDEPHMLKLLERIIREKTQYEVTTISNSLEVEDVLGDQRYDLIISDLRMPGMDGMDILRFVREHQRDELVIIITAFGSLESATRVMELGAFDYITKPFKKEQIIYTIDRAMRFQAMRKEAHQWEEITGREPFSAAVAEFEVAYVRRLVIRWNGDPEKVAEVSGLPIDRIKKILEEN
ncbi:MAG: response regulator [candidate division Zixibacteria bacterium]|nr:response regulator [candidate division Zixibacteria bacterium]